MEICNGERRHSLRIEKDLGGSIGEFRSLHVIDVDADSVKEIVARSSEGYAYIFGFPILRAEVDCDSDTISLDGKCKWITCFIGLPEGYDPRDIVASIILLNDIVSP